MSISQRVSPGDFYLYVFIRNTISGCVDNDNHAFATACLLFAGKLWIGTFFFSGAKVPAAITNRLFFWWIVGHLSHVIKNLRFGGSRGNIIIFEFNDYEDN